MLDIYNEQLSGYGQSIYEKRKAFIENLVPVFSRFYTYISGGTEDTGLRYESQVTEEGDVVSSQGGIS